MRAVDAFDLGFAWARGLHGQRIEDSRAVGRTLLSDLFTGLDINIDGFDSFKSGDEGIVEAKCRIKAAILALSPAPDATVSENCPRADCGEVVGDYPDPRWDQGQCPVCGKWFHKSPPQDVGREATVSETDEELAQQIHQVAGCHVNSERTKKIIEWFRSKGSTGSARDAVIESALKLLPENADERRMFDDTCKAMSWSPLQLIANSLFVERNMNSSAGASYYEQKTIAVNELQKAARSLASGAKP